MDKHKATGSEITHFNVKVEKKKNPFRLKHHSVQRIEKTSPATDQTPEFTTRYYIGTGYLPIPRYIVKELTDGVTPTEQIGYGNLRDFTDSFATTDIAAVLTEKGFSDSLVSNTDDINTILVFKSIVDPFTALDQATIILNSGIVDSFNLNDIAFVETDFFRTFDESINQTDDQRLAFEKTLNDDATILDLVGIPDGSTYQFAKSISSTSITADNFVRQWVAFKELQSTANPTENAAIQTSRPLTSQTGTVNDDLQKAWTAVRSFSDEFNIGQFSLKAVGKILSDSVSSQVSEPNFISSKALSETFTPNDLIQLNTARPFSESLTVSETLEILKVLLSEFFDSFNAIDSTLSDINKALFDSVDAEDLIGIIDGSTYGLYKSLGDSLFATDNLLTSFETSFNSQSSTQEEYLLQLTKQFLDILDATELLRFSLQKTLQDNLNILDNSKLDFDASLTDLINKFDSTALGISKFAPLEEIFSLEEHSFNFNTGYLEQINPSESITYNMDFAFSESQTFSEVIDILWDQGIILDEIVTPGDINAIDLIKDLTDIVNTIDLIGVPDGLTYNIAQSFNENVNSTESLSYAITSFFSSSTLISDTLLADLSKDLQESLITGDATTFDINQGISDSASLNEEPVISSLIPKVDQVTTNSNTFMGLGKNLSDSLTFSENINFAFAQLLQEESIPNDLEFSFSQTKALTETFELLDDASLALAIPSITDSITNNDIPTIDNSKGIQDGITIADNSPLFSYSTTFNNSINSSESINSFTFSKPLSDQASALDLVGIPDGSTFSFVTSFSSSFSTAQSQTREAGKNISDTVFGSEAGELIERSYFSSDYVEFDPTNHDPAYDAESQQTF